MGAGHHGGDVGRHAAAGGWFGKKAQAGDEVAWDLDKQRRQAYSLLGLRPHEFYDLDPFDLHEMLGAAVERREYDRQMLAWHAVVVVNGVGMRRKPLKVSDLIPASPRAGMVDGQGPDSHRRVMAILKKASN